MPFAVVALAVFLSGARPYTSAAAFLLGIGLSYTAAGVLIILGLGEVFDSASAWVIYWWENPDALDYVLGIVIGATSDALRFESE